MKIYCELNLNTFEAWSGAIPTLERIRTEGKIAELESMLEELYPDGMDETQLNDLLWFDDEWIFETLGIRTEEQIRDELEEAEKELEELKERYNEECEELAETDNPEDFSPHDVLMKCSELWENDYALEAEELEDRIEELKEELETI